MIEIFMRIMDVFFPSRFPQAFHGKPPQAFAIISIVVWREDYFLTKLKTYHPTMCHVPANDALRSECLINS